MGTSRSASSALAPLRYAEYFGKRVDHGVGPFPQASSLRTSGLLAQGKSSGRAATVSELEDIRDAFVSAALTAQEAGFDGVEIHGAYGFLLRRQVLIYSTYRPGVAGNRSGKDPIWGSRDGPSSSRPFRYSRWEAKVSRSI
jgi:hypothetical protein